MLKSIYDEKTDSKMIGLPDYSAFNIISRLWLHFYFTIEFKKLEKDLSKHVLVTNLVKNPNSL
jgi:hypothetical protein